MWNGWSALNLRKYKYNHSGDDIIDQPDEMIALKSNPNCTMRCQS
jgi:hypothetical protein